MTYPYIRVTVSPCSSRQRFCDCTDFTAAISSELSTFTLKHRIVIPAHKRQTYRIMVSGNKLYALCVLALVLVASGLPVCTASRKLLQRGGGGGGGGAAEATNTFNTNSVRAQAATAQAITETVNNGGGLPNTRRAGNVGVATGWAAGQQNNIFTQTDYASSPGRAGPVGSNAGTNTVTGSRGPSDTAGTRFGTLTTSDTSLVSSLDVRPGRAVG